MEIRDAIEDEEHCYIDDGEEICCPICGTAWSTDIEGDVTKGTCQHLRFSHHSEWDEIDFDFFNEWDQEGFEDLVEAARAEDKDDEMDILSILSEIQHPDVDKAITYQWHDAPMYHPWMIWGYKGS